MTHGPDAPGRRPLADQRRARLSCLLGLVVFALYVVTLFPGVGGVYNHGDSAKFQFLGAVPGIGHPPGNPLYLALLSLVQRVPLGTAALRANLASAACAAASAGLLADAAYRLRGALAAWLTAAAFALGGASWIFATEAEVYALAGLMVALVLHGLVRVDEAPPGPLPAAGLAAFALGLANHLSLVFAGPALAWATCKALREGRRITRGGALSVLALGACALALYAALPWLDARAVYSEAGALALGVWAAGVEQRLVAASFVLLSLAPGAVLRVREARAVLPFDVLEDVLGDPGQELLDLPELVASVPEGALITQPCTHYGCAQVVNYYRFVEPLVARRKLELVSLAGSQRSWQPDPPRTISASEARTRVVCTLFGHELAMLEQAGAHMTRIDRGALTVRGEQRTRLPVFCSTPESGTDLR